MTLSLLPQLLKTVKMKILFFYTEMLIKVFPIYLKKNLELPDLESTHQNILEVEQLTTKNVKVLNLSKSKEPSQLQGLPLNPKLSNFNISPDESKIALTNTTNEGVELWIADLKTLTAKRIYGSNINATLGNPITWLKNSNELLIKTIPDSRKALIDRNSIVPTGPTITENEGQKAQNRTYQDLIKNPDDAFNFTQLSLSNIVKINIEGRKKSF